MKLKGGTLVTLATLFHAEAYTPSQSGKRHWPKAQTMLHIRVGGAVECLFIEESLDEFHYRANQVIQPILKPVPRP